MRCVITRSTRNMEKLIFRGGIPRGPDSDIPLLQVRAASYIYGSWLVTPDGQMAAVCRAGARRPITIIHVVRVHPEDFTLEYLYDKAVRVNISLSMPSASPPSPKPPPAIG